MVLYIPGGAGFLPSTVSPRTEPNGPLCLSSFGSGWPEGPPFLKRTTSKYGSPGLSGPHVVHHKIDHCTSHENPQS